MLMQHVLEAESEARRFLRRVRELKERVKRQPSIERDMKTGFGWPETAAVRRASLDLTRALAKMRRR